MKIGYFLASEEYSPARTDRAGQAGRAGRLPRALDLRPLPPVERRAGPQRLRVVGDRRARRGDLAAGDHRRDLPDGPHPPGGHRPGRGDQRRAARGALHARRRQRRGAQRAHPRRPLARGRRPPGDARGGGRGHPAAVAGRPAEPSRPPLHRRERAHLRPARRAAADPRLRLRAEGDQARGADRRRVRDHLAGQGRDRPLPLRRRQGAGARRHQGLLTAPTRTRRSRPCTASGPTRRCRASSRRSCRRRRTSSRRASWSRPITSPSPVGPDLDVHVESLQAYADAGVDELFVQQIGPDQDLFFERWAPEILDRGSRHEGRRHRCHRQRRHERRRPRWAATRASTRSSGSPGAGPTGHCPRRAVVGRHRARRPRRRTSRAPTRSSTWPG